MEKQSDAEDKAPALWVRKWFESKREGSVLLKVQVKNRDKKKVKVCLAIEVVEGENIKVPMSAMKERFFDADTKCLLHLEKIDPRKPWGKIKVNL